LGVEWDVADLVADKQRDPLEAIEIGRASLALRAGERGDPFGGRFEENALAGEAGPDPQGDGEVRPCRAGRAEQDHALIGVQEVELTWSQLEPVVALICAGNRSAMASLGAATLDCSGSGLPTFQIPSNIANDCSVDVTQGVVRRPRWRACPGPETRSASGSARW
jgi:hypothetical protein